MADLITRQAAIDVLDRNHILGQGLLNDTLDHIADAIMALPSAQPDSKELSFTHKALDTVSRQAAIEALDKEYRCTDQTDDWDGLKTAMLIVENLPSAQPETHEERTETHACDCIERQAAIDALDCISGVEEVLRSLPSAQSEPIRINLNEPIKVKLTDWGKEIYYHQYDRTNQIAGREICKPMFPREDENGYTEFQLWCFIELYGMHMGMTLPNVIEPLEIVYER